MYETTVCWNVLGTGDEGGAVLGKGLAALSISVQLFPTQQPRDLDRATGPLLLIAGRYFEYSDSTPGPESIKETMQSCDW